MEMIPTAERIVEICAKSYNSLPLICMFLTAVCVYNLIMLLGVAIKRYRLIALMNTLKEKKKKTADSSFWDQK